MTNATTARLTALEVTAAEIIDGLDSTRKTELIDLVNSLRYVVVDEVIKLIEEGDTFENWFKMNKEINLTSDLYKEPEFNKLYSEIQELYSTDMEEFREYYDIHVKKVLDDLRKEKDKFDYIRESLKDHLKNK